MPTRRLSAKPAGSGGDACCCSCHPLIGDTIHFNVSGLASKGCVSLGVGTSTEATFASDPNGDRTATWDGTKWGFTTLASYHRKDYAADDSCGGDPTAEGDFDYDISILCTDNNFTFGGSVPGGSGGFGAIAIPADDLFTSYTITIPYQEG